MPGPKSSQQLTDKPCTVFSSQLYTTYRQNILTYHRQLERTAYSV